MRTAFDQRLLGRTALSGYRFAMRALLVGAIALALLAIVIAVSLWQVHWALALLALPPAIGAGALGWWRMTWGAPLDWLEEHADPNRTVELAELPERLRALAEETRSIANVPARLSDELDALAADVDADAGGGSRAPHSL